ncbi:MAG: glutamine-hydrolyzing carbamoyl-phosphate synthase small subunit [Chlamydiota bacterium]|jgi:carbamoyl-phosphate synthase small subunit
MQMTPSKLTLHTGETFDGLSPSWQDKEYLGEIVFTTGMSGYVETLTDPSFCDQIIVFTYPLIGNYGVPQSNDWESAKIHAAGVVISEPCLHPAHFESSMSLLDWLKSQNVPLISHVDTRAITKRLRSQGVMLAAIGNNEPLPSSFFDPNQTHLVQKVSCQKITSFGNKGKKIIAIDCGMKENIMRHLKRYNGEIVRVPYDYDFTHEHFDGVFISNGPGDPSYCKETISILQKVLQLKKPTFGICLGSQLMALAIQAQTYKLTFGHRGQNQPCLNLIDKKAYLTSQNHGWAIDEATLPDDWSVYFRNINDGSVEGIIHKQDPFFAVQFHPESNPGPQDTAFLFEKFFKMVDLA